MPTHAGKRSPLPDFLQDCSVKCVGGGRESGYKEASQLSLGGAWVLKMRLRDPETGEQPTGTLMAAEHQASPSSGRSD